MPDEIKIITDSKTITREKPSVIVLKIMLVFLTGLLILSTMSNCASRSPLINCRQLVVVVTPDWDASQGILYRFARTEVYNDWQPVTNPVPIILGRSGMGWGRGLHPAVWKIGPHKSEGDGRSPAGIFKLGDAFGFSPPVEFLDLKIPYRSINEFLECIDDVNSRYYAQLIERDAVSEADWNTSEVISQSPNAYYLGVVVEYNTEKPVKDAGSCIFLHCWTAPDDSTAGCTTLDRPEMEKLVRWLDATAQPKIVQLPLPVYRHLRYKWQLPPIE